MKNAQIAFDENFLNKIDRIASNLNKTRSAVVREAVRYWLRKKEIEDFEKQWINSLKTKNEESLGQGSSAQQWFEIEEWEEQ
jgi:metal-responsive CopG/Arc/MetJ family transcriptional regulator